MSNDSEVSVAKAVRRLMSADSDAWFQFLSALVERSNALDTTLVNSAPDALQHYQGRAKEARTLIAELQKAPELANKVQQQERANAHTARKP